MNARRRGKLRLLATNLDGLRAGLQEIISEEQEAFDNLPEAIQYSERGEHIENGLTELESIDDSFTELEGEITTFTEEY